MTSPLFAWLADIPERTRAISPNESFLVQAPAGSGKTELLIQRYLKLLGVVEKPERIQAITFTRKAAGEMRERIIRALEMARTGDVPSEEHTRTTYDLARAALHRDRELSWGLLENPSRMKLQTIDSLCSGIVAQMPWLARQGCPLEVIEDAESLYGRAAQRTVMMLEMDTPFRDHLGRLLLHLDNNGSQVAQLIASMLATRDQWVDRFLLVDDDVRKAQEQTLAEIVGEGYSSAENMIPPTDLKELRTLVPGSWHDIAQVLLTGQDEWRRQLDKRCGFLPAHKAEKRRCLDLIDRFREIRGLREALAFIKILPVDPSPDQRWEITKVIFACLKLATAQLKMVFQEEGLIDFCEVSLAARWALGHAEDPTELALKLDAQIDHLLIDEFQDTSLGQFELTKQLIEGWEPRDGRTLFLVGDPMQSIYRFRQAEVGLFLKTRDEGIGAIYPSSLVLSSNYRSAEGIVEWVNRVFGTVFPPRNDQETGAISYSESFAAKPNAEAAVQLHGFAEGQDVAEAQKVVSLIREARRVDPAGTVAILVRARSHLPAIVEQLKRADITFRAVELDDLSERPVVRDLLSLTRALLHPGDRLSWLAVLRSPCIGLTLSDLHALAAAEGKAMVFDLLHANRTALTQDGQARCARVVGIFEVALSQRGSFPLRTWVEQTWRALGGPWCYEEHGSSQDAADYLDLLERDQSGGDLPDFDGFAGKVGRLKAKADPTANEWLQVMTIHKAKGLEFDTVILPGLGRKSRFDDPKLFLFHRGLMAPIKEATADSDPVYQYLAALDKRRAEHELVRQLYVATTRARRRLHLLGFACESRKNGPRPTSGSFLAALWEGLTEEERQIFTEAATVNPMITAMRPPQDPIRRVPVDWQPPPAPAPVPLARAADIHEIEQPTFEWVGEGLRHAGTVVHELLRRIARTGRRDIDLAVARRALSQLGVPAQDLEQTAARVQEAVDRTLKSEIGRWILDQHEQARGELAVAGVVDGAIVRGTIDRTFVDDQGVRWIIDFKTSAHEGGGIVRFLDEQERRYRPQLQRYARLLAPLGQPVRLGLYFPLLDQWREWPAE